MKTTKNSSINGNYLTLPTLALSCWRVALCVIVLGALLVFATTEASAQNLLTNGDFEMGNVGFISDYIYSPTNLWPETTYAVVTNPLSVHGGVASFGDHTTGSGLMLAVNGSPYTNKVVWGQTVNVTSNTMYFFSGWGALWTTGSPPVLRILINGERQGGDIQLIVTNGYWQSFSAVWNSSSSTQAVIKIYDANTAWLGNDFALDDLSFVVMCSPGAVFNVTGGGTNCAPASFPVGLDGSQTGLDYWLMKDGVYSGTTVSGTGTNLNFGYQSVSGVYTVLASNTTTHCTGLMNGNAIVNVISPPTNFNVTGGGTNCAPASFPIGLDSSEMGVDYWLVRDGVYCGAPVSGTGTNLDFGYQSVSGVYTVLASNITTSCTNWMNGNATVLVISSPMIFNVTGGGTNSNCAPASFPVGLDGSETNADYWLIRDYTDVIKITNGTGTNLNFGYQSVSGVYTVLASNITTSCTSWMNGNATVNVPTNSPSIITQPANTLITNNYPASFGVQPWISLWAYQWLKNGTNLVDGTNIFGSTSNILTIKSATTNDAGSYWVVVTNACGSVTSSVATLTVVVPPFIITQPTNQFVLVGNCSPLVNCATFSVIAGGDPTLYYQWQKNGSNLTNNSHVFGATNDTLTLCPTNVNDAGNYIGNYRVIVANSWGSATSSVATLHVTNRIVLPVSVLLYEPFSEWCENEPLGWSGSSGNVWSYGNTATIPSSPRITTNAALSRLGLASDPYSPPRKGFNINISSPGIVGQAKTRGAPFAAVTNGTVYASFLLNVKTNPSSSRVFVGLSASKTYKCLPYSGVFIDPSRRLLISKYNGEYGSITPPAGSPATSPLKANTTYLVVLRYQFSTNYDIIDDEFALWLNPPAPWSDTNIPPPTISTTDGSDLTNVQSFAYIQPPGSPQLAAYLDEIRVATDWEDVTPVGCSPGASYDVTGGGTGCGPTNFPVGLNGSETDCDYWLARDYTDVITITSGTGTNLDFGYQTNSGDYVVLASNRTTTCIGWMNGSAIVDVMTAPIIITQPTNIFGTTVPVATNAQCTLTVIASGDNLTFQWRRDGTNLNDGGHFSGTATSNLTINPTTSADAAASTNGYDCVISGSCDPSPVTSSRVGLTNVPARTNYWAGQLPDGVTAAPVWDVVTTTNWSTCTGCSSIRGFEFGDNVRFDDNAIGTINVICGSPFLTPSSVTLKTYQNYSFSGPGSIVGPCSVVWMGYSGGTLSITNANYYTGGTTISNILVNIANNSAFGLGPVTLKTNAILNPYGVLNITNDIVVTDNSTIQVNNTSQSALTLGGALSGTGGTLTFYNNISAVPTIRLTHTNFTFNRPVVISWPANATNLVLASYNSNGNQIFNGVISGNGQLHRREYPGGNVILNAQNTYTGGTVLQAGGVGFGADSTPTTPGSITSGPIGTGTLMLENLKVMSVFASGGAHTVANPVVFLAKNLPQTLVFTGTNSLIFSGSFDLGGTTRPIRVDNTSTASIISGVISNGGLTKLGPGPLTLSGNNTYTDLTVVSDGALLVNGQINSPVTVVGGTLGGTGTILQAVTVQGGGTLSAGTSIGTLTISNALTLQDGSTTRVEVNADSSACDLVRGMTSVMYGGILFVANLSGPGTLTPTNTFTIFDATSYSGAFASVIPWPDVGLCWDTSTLTTDGTLRIKSCPVITTFGIESRTNFWFGGTNGAPDSGYTVLSSTNVALPLTNWVVESSNAFDGSGAFSVTNAMEPGITNKFYILKVYVP